MLRKIFENKMIDPLEEQEAERGAEQFEADIHLIAIAMLERHLNLTHRTTLGGAYAFQTGNAVFNDHVEAYKAILRKGISTWTAAQQVSAICSVGRPGAPSPWPVFPGVPLPTLLPKYEKRMTETKSDLTGVKCGQIEFSTRR